MSDTRAFNFTSSLKNRSDPSEILITSIKVESATLHYPNLSLYDGSNWNTISGNFSDGKYPVSAHADGTNIYYVYGDANNLTSWNETKAIKSMKLTK